MPRGRNRQPTRAPRRAALRTGGVVDSPARSAGPDRRHTAVAGDRRGHAVTCPGCSERFDLFSAEWCGCDTPQRSKFCPGCGHCLCRRPEYAHPWLWVQAPTAFERHGFARLFVAYL